jgi:hypothetical protein
MSMPENLSAVLGDLNPWWEPSPTRPREALAWPVRRGVHPRILDQLLRLDDRRAQVLLGPRQVGKTTLLKQLADDLLEIKKWPAGNLTYFDFEDFRLKREVSPQEIADLRPAGADPQLPRILLLDEVHRFPRWDRWLKYAVDNSIGRIVATDSSASLLREAGRESGLGRWDEILLEGLTFGEFVTLNAGSPVVADIGPPPVGALLERYLAVGGFPAFATEREPVPVRARLRDDIVDRAIRRDLIERVDDPERLRRLFVYLIQQSGSEQNSNDRAADLGVDARSVAKWTDLLLDTFLLVALPRAATSAKASARLRGRPRLYAADHGLVAAFAAAPPSDSDVRGRIFEAVVFRHLREVARARRGEVRYLRWGDQLEVDFLLELELERERFAIEVTQSVQVKPEKLRALLRGADRAGAGRAVLIYGGLTGGEVEGVPLVPLAALLVDPWAALTGAEP